MILTTLLFMVDGVPNSRRSGKREGGPKAEEILQNVVGRTAVPIGLGQDAGQRVLSRPHVDNLEMIDDPIAASQDSRTHVGEICYLRT